MLQFLSEHFILLRKHREQIADQTSVELTGRRAHGKDPLHIQEEHFTRFYSNRII